MSTPFELRAYNPRTASAETLESLFVGRQALLDEVLEDLRRQTGSKSRQHWLIYGPRGMGKTHLSGLVYHLAQKEPALAQAYFPIWLPELDAYTAYSAGKLLAQVGEQAAQELQARGEQAPAHELRQQIAALVGLGDDDEYFQGALGLLRDLAASRNRILLILLENLDSLLAALSRQRGGLEARRLRQVLLECTELLFVSTTPTRYLSALHHPKEPLFGHFRERRLEGLTAEDVTTLLTRLSEKTGRPLPVDARRSWLLHRLTGGNPRAIGMAFGALGGGTDLADVVADFERLLDLQTPYFEARLAHLAARERAIVEALAMAPTTLTLQEIAQRSRLPEKSLSTQVKRLEEEGHVQPALGEKGKGSLYELADGLLRLWFQYRRGRRELEPLIRLLALWYRPEDIERRLFELPLEFGRGFLGNDHADLARVQLQAALQWAQSEEGKQERARMSTELVLRAALDVVKAALADNQKELKPRTEELGALLEGEEATLPGLVVAFGYFCLGLAFSLHGLSEKALVAIDRGLTAQNTPAEVRFLLLERKASFLGRLGRNRDALATCLLALELREQVQPANVVRVLRFQIRLLAELEQFDDALDTFNRWLALAPPIDSHYCEALGWRAFALIFSGRIDEGEQQIRELLSVAENISDRSQLNWFSSSLLLLLALGHPVTWVDEVWSRARADNPSKSPASEIFEAVREVLGALGDPRGRVLGQRKRRALARVAPEIREVVSNMVEAILGLHRIASRTAGK